MTKRRKSGRKRVQKLKNPLPSPATCGAAKKDVANQKNWGQKVEKHGVFSLFVCRFWTGAFTNRCSPYCFLQWFLKASVTTYQKHRVLAEKCPPPGKPVTFYECHPEDHAPAPSVRDIAGPLFLERLAVHKTLSINVGWIDSGFLFYLPSFLSQEP